MSEPTAAELRKIKRLRAKLARGEITETEAREQGFPPADPIKEKR